MVANLVIRPMQAADLEQVLVIDTQSFSMPWPASAYRYELKENPLSSLWVVEAPALGGVQGDHRVIGMLVIWNILDEAHVATIAIHPDFRSQGIAKHLLARGLADSIQKGVVSATLEVRSSNSPAQKLYERFGFQIVGRRPRYYQDNNEDALIMTVDGLSPTYLDWLDHQDWMNSTDPTGSAGGM